MHMMKRLLNITRYPSLVIFFVAGASIMIVAFASYNLLQLGMANLRFVGEHGWQAIENGALLQMLQILGYGAVSLSSFIVFKICESELVQRARRWMNR